MSLTIQALTTEIEARLAELADEQQRLQEARRLLIGGKPDDKRRGPHMRKRVRNNAPGVAPGFSPVSAERKQLILSLMRSIGTPVAGTALAEFSEGQISVSGARAAFAHLVAEGKIERAHKVRGGGWAYRVTEPVSVSVAKDGPVSRDDVLALIGTGAATTAADLANVLGVPWQKVGRALRDLKNMHEIERVTGGGWRAINAANWYENHTREILAKVSDEDTRVDALARAGA